MTAQTGLVDEYSFAAEGMGGTAASSALRRTALLARFAPTRSAVEAIATLTEIGLRIEAALVAGDQALAKGHRNEAVNRLDEAINLMDDMSRVALSDGDTISPGNMRNGSAA